MIIDTLLILVLLIGLAICSLIGYKVLGQLNTAIQADTSLTAETKAVVSQANTQYPSLFDGIFVFAFVLLWGVTLIGAFMIDSHPVFFIVGMVLLVFVFIIAGHLSNSYQTLVDDPEFSTLSVSFPMTNFIINNMVEFIMVIGFTVGVALYAKMK